MHTICKHSKWQLLSYISHYFYLHIIILKYTLIIRVGIPFGLASQITNSIFIAFSWMHCEQICTHLTFVNVYLFTYVHSLFHYAVVRAKLLLLVSLCGVYNLTALSFHLFLFCCCQPASCPFNYYKRLIVHFSSWRE